MFGFTYWANSSTLILWNSGKLVKVFLKPLVTVLAKLSKSGLPAGGTIKFSPNFTSLTATLNAAFGAVVVVAASQSSSETDEPKVGKTNRRRVSHVSWILTGSARSYAHSVVWKRRHRFVLLYFLVDRIVRTSFDNKRQIQALIVRKHHILYKNKYSKIFRYPHA